jgi:hypothetical protein
MDDEAKIHTGSEDWNRRFEVVSFPPAERIQFLRAGYDVRIGDFGWASPRYPKDQAGLIHLTGYDEKYLNIWYADFKTAGVRYVGQKPFPAGTINRFPVKHLA